MGGASRLKPIVSALLICIAVFAGCGEVGENLPPQIFSVEASSEVISPGGEVKIEAKAGDPEGDELTYSWEAEAGSILGSGPVVTWKAPGEEGVYEIAVEVSDGEERDRRSVKLIVWAERSGDYYPLALGNRWVYLDRNGYRITFEVVDVITIEGTNERSYVLEKRSSDPRLEGVATYAYLGKHPDVIYQHAASVAPGSPDTMIFVPWLPLYKFPLVPGRSWEVEFKAKLPEGYYIGEGRARYEVVDESTLTVPAGRFEHVIQVREEFRWTLMDRTLDETISRKWLAPDVGLVKIVEEQTRGGQTVSNELELIEYDLKGGKP
ncbi:hypothetical protein DRP77_04505 [Candidatus Poribacteria bacterium]|nr:MAG: hypothetical protein DRP77_04505 [Candidatus Poribacteria bacterium]